MLIGKGNRLANLGRQLQVLRLIRAQQVQIAVDHRIGRIHVAEHLRLGGVSQPFVAVDVQFRARRSGSCIAKRAPGEAGSCSPPNGSKRPPASRSSNRCPPNPAALTTKTIGSKDIVTSSGAAGITPSAAMARSDSI